MKKPVRIKLSREGPFYKELRDIVGSRRATIDRKFTRDVSYDRILGAAVKEPEWIFLKEKLKRMPRMEDFK